MQGVVDSKNDGLVLFEVTPVVQGDPIAFMSISNELLPPAIAEGDEINLTILTDKSLERYCH